MEDNSTKAFGLMIDVVIFSMLLGVIFFFTNAIKKNMDILPSQIEEHTTISRMNADNAEIYEGIRLNGSSSAQFDGVYTLDETVGLIINCCEDTTANIVINTKVPEGYYVTTLPESVSAAIKEGNLKDLRTLLTNQQQNPEYCCYYELDQQGTIKNYYFYEK